MTTKKVELLAPAGTLEKLKIAVHYGADAVYIGGQAYGLRSHAGNFDYDEMKEAVAYAHPRGVKVYVASNMVTHVGDEKGAGDFFKQLDDIGIDAVIISDPALMEICASQAPGLEMHLSTQQSAVNYETLNFWQEAGLTRCVLGREVSMAEIKEIRSKTSVEIEAFIHGAMCISYSGRCTLSNHMAHRDANRGGCCQSCRWKYDLYEMPILGQKESISGRQLDPEEREAFSMSAVDLSMIRHVGDLIESGIDSFKIEGRMKSIHYISTVVNVYRQAIDAYYMDPLNYNLDQAWIDEMWKAAQRELATGFYYGRPDENQQLFTKGRRKQKYKFCGQVLDYDEDKSIATIQQRNLFKVGDQLEFYGPGMRLSQHEVKEMWNEKGEKIDRAPHAMMTVKLKLKEPVLPHDMVRRVRN